MKYLLILLLTIFIGCQNKTNNNFLLNAMVGNNQIKDNLSVFDLIENIEIISTSGKNGELIDIGQLKVFSNYIFMVDSYTKKLYRLDISNNSINQILKYGNGPGEIIEPSKLLLDEDKLLILSKPQSKIFVTDFDGNVFQETNLDFFPSDFSSYENSFYFMNGFFEKSGNYIKRSDFNLINSGFFAKYPVNDSQMDFAFTGNLQDNLYSFPFGSTIYEIKEKEKIRFQFQLDNNIKENELFDHNLIQTYLKDFKQPKNFLQKFFVKENQGFFQFSINNKIKYSILLPSGQFFGTEDFDIKYNPFLVFGQPKDYRNGYFYVIIGEKFKEWFLLSNQKEEIIEFYSKKSKILGEYLSKLEENSSPLIIKFSLKKSYP